MRTLPVCLFLAVTLPLHGRQAAQATTQPAPTPTTEKTPDWQKQAGGRREFDVASVREDLSGKYVTPPYSIDSDDDYTAAGGGDFTAIASLETYISFAYKLDQQYSMLTNLPKWASTKRFAVHAKASGNPTKDQMRLMMQSLLAERFKLELHFEPKERPAFALTLIRPGVPGPKLRLHADGPPCNPVVPYAGPGSLTASIDMFPCNTYMALNRPDHALLAGARNTTVRLMAAFFSSAGHLGRPIVDQTGIDDKIDFSLEFTPEQPGRPTPEGDLPSPQGETFLEAIKDQLGLKLKPTTALLDIPVVDHVEMPAEN